MHVDVISLTNARGKYVLHEVTTTDDVFHDRRGGIVLKTKRRVWPLAKLDNGRGIQFDSRREAMEFLRDNTPDSSVYGERTLSALKRYGP